MTSTDAKYNGEPREWLRTVRAVEAAIAGLKYAYKTNDDPAHIIGYYYMIDLKNLPPKDEVWRTTSIDDLIDETERDIGALPPRIKQSIKKFSSSTYGTTQRQMFGSSRSNAENIDRDCFSSSSGNDEDRTVGSEIGRAHV